MRDELADWLHERMCSRAPACPRYSNPEGGPHWDYFQQRAEALISKLEPEIGSANVMPAVRVVVEELL